MENRFFDNPSANTLFQLSQALPEEDRESVAPVIAAIEEVISAAAKIRGSNYSNGAATPNADLDKFVEPITDLRELFEHLGKHCEEAAESLWHISDVLANRIDTPTR